MSINIPFPGTEVLSICLDSWNKVIGRSNMKEGKMLFDVKTRNLCNIIAIRLSKFELPLLPYNNDVAVLGRQYNFLSEYEILDDNKENDNNTHQIAFSDRIGINIGEIVALMENDLNENNFEANVSKKQWPKLFLACDPVPGADICCFEKPIPIVDSMTVYFNNLESNLSLSADSFTAIPVLLRLGNNLQMVLEVDESIVPLLQTSDKIYCKSFQQIASSVELESYMNNPKGHHVLIQPDHKTYIHFNPRIEFYCGINEVHNVVQRSGEPFTETASDDANSFNRRRKSILFFIEKNRIRLNLQMVKKKKY